MCSAVTERSLAEAAGDLQPRAFPRCLGLYPLAFGVSDPGPGARGPVHRKSCCVLCTGVPPHDCDRCPHVTRNRRGLSEGLSRGTHSQFLTASSISCFVGSGRR